MTTWLRDQLTQLREGLLHAPAILGRMSARSWLWFGVYLLLSGALLIGIALALSSQEKNLQRALFAFLFPSEWHAVLEFLTAFVFKSQAQQVVVNVILFMTLTVVSIIFFWAKELLSQSVERDLHARGVPHADPTAWRDNPVWFEALEEIKWTLIGLALMFIVLWMGHDTSPIRKTLATILSYLVLFFSTAVNFIAPPMQRRQMQYSQVLSAVFNRPLHAFGFGAAMALPQVLVLHLLTSSDLPVMLALVLLFTVNIVFIAWSAAAGTVAGVALMPLARESKPLGWSVRLLASALVVGVLVSGVWLGLQLGVMLRDKSQILKCSYAVDWSTLKVDKPALGGLLKGEVSVGLGFDVQVTNPNSLPVRIEKNRLVLEDEGVVVAETRLAPLDVPAAGTTKTRIALDLKVRAASLLEGASLDPSQWGLVLYLELDDGFEFPIPIRADR